ncbi:MarR family transcriptional regulator [Streptomyces lunaelactis]|uniref:MarR family transcriptional regulator n=1 Tax=Streptomyces lunaelactis TaxID=1535768 RepID=A0A2R4T328_9ACTN|nr:transcriptional regulator [Streptomyces lunaelactis]AVZ73522.1 MarR family transcriptional regulator [Streptomyces lunaelactis]NUK03203.1 transcriptional regulator [Streptomyces lunaelactis]NUK10047.1 transcriptional regulator [Streptomyces lunaelactis]NUK17532.1 transcriptional regulator [Streptomyces lunaelactis]NUK28258.1 transcriptional regulator [Streptomyces lunaelactis]
MTGSRFNEVIHAPNRLQICTMLAAVETMAFSTLRDALDVSDSVLSKHVKILQTAGYLDVTKARGASYPRTWIALTPDGRQAFSGHIAELRRIVELGDLVRRDPVSPGE